MLDGTNAQGVSSKPVQHQHQSPWKPTCTSNQSRRATSLTPLCCTPLLSRDIVQAIVERSGIQAGSGYQLGVSKVFLRAGQMAILDKLRTGGWQGLIIERLAGWGAGEQGDLWLAGWLGG